MGTHRARRISARDLRKAYAGLREAYERLLREHLELKNGPSGLLDSVPSGPLSSGTKPVLWQAPPCGAEPMGVDTACELVRSTGLLTSPGLEQ
jgi:hypothetical protein